MKILACNSNRTLAKSIACELNTKLIKASITCFPDREICVEINESVRGEDVFVIQSTSSPANDNLMELLVTIDALKRGSARHVTVVIPYFGYARQDRKTGPRTPISSKLVANLISIAGTDRVLTFELHTKQIQGFFDIPIDHLSGTYIFANDITKRFNVKELIIVSPDMGGIIRARALAESIGTEIAIVDKRRKSAGVSDVLNIVGSVEGKKCVIVDDLVDSADTICKAAEKLIEEKALSVDAYVSHGVLSGNAINKLLNSSIDCLTVTDSIEIKDTILDVKKFRQLSVDKLIAEAMKRISLNQSVSSLF